MLLQEVDLDAQRLGTRAHHRERGRRRFLHHVAKLAGQDQLALAGHQRGLDLQQVAADLGPGQAGDQADFVLFLGAAIVEAAHAQVLVQVPRRDLHHRGLRLARGGLLGRLLHRLRTAQRDLLDHLAAYLGDLALQVAHAGFARVVAHDVAHRILGDGQLLRLEAVGLELLGHQVTQRDAELLVLGIARNADDLHAVQQGAGDVQRVGGRHEHHLGQVEVHLEVVVVEGMVLFGIEHLQQRRRRVAAEVHRHLVDLVEHEQRVAGADLVEVLHDPARHRADVGAAMAADLGLVAHAAQRHPHELAVGGLGDRLAQGGLAHARRPDQAQDRPLHLLHPRLHRQVLEDALLDLLQPVVVGIERVLRGLEVLANLAALLPWHAKQPVQVVAHHRGLGRHRRHLLELVEFGARLGFHRLRHAGLGDAAHQLLQLAGRIVQVAQLLLDGLHLFVEVVLALALLHLRLDPAADALLHLLDVDLALDQADQQLQPLADVGAFEQALLVGQAYADVGGDSVSQAAGIVDSRQGLQQLRRQLAIGLDVLFEQPGQGTRHRLHFAVAAAAAGLDQLAAPVQRAVALGDAVHVHARGALHQHLDRAVGQLQQLQDLRQGADRVEVAGIGVVGFGGLLRDEQDLLVGLHRLLQRAHRLVPPDEQRDDHVREHHHVAQWQDGQLQGVGSVAGHAGSGGVGMTAAAVLPPLWGQPAGVARSGPVFLFHQPDRRSPGRRRGFFNFLNRNSTYSAEATFGVAGGVS